MGYDNSNSNVYSKHLVICYSADDTYNTCPSVNPKTAGNAWVRSQHCGY